MFCPNCKFWEVKKEDIFCAYCGEQLIRLYINPDVLRIYEPNGSGTVKLKNEGFFPVDVIKIKSKEKWLQVDKLSEGKIRINPKEEFPFLFNLVELKKFDSGIIEFHTSGGIFDLDVMYLPHPEIKIIPGKIEIKNEVTKNVKLKLTKGEEVLINRASISYKSIEINKKQFPILLTSEELKEIKLSWNSEDIKDSTENIYFEIEGLPKKLIREIEFKKINFPELKIIGRPKIYKKVFRYEKYIELKREEVREKLKFYPLLLEEYEETIRKLEEELSFNLVIKNTGREKLKIDKFTYVNLPIEFDGGKERKDIKTNEEVLFNFKVNTDSVNYGLYEGEIKIFSNSINSPDSILVRINIDELHDFPESSSYVGIDFGTTNSTIAFRKSETSDIETIIFKGNKSYIPSSIEFNPDQKGQFSIGWDAHHTFFHDFKGNINEIFGKELRAVSFTKKVITRNKKIKTIGDMGLYPREIATLIIKILLIYVERYSKLKVKRAVIGVPPKFSYNQVQQIKNCCLDAGLEKIHVLDESTAAGFSYMGLCDLNEFTLLVYDFGGGTTDISLLQIKKGKIEIEVNVLGLLGERDFGGEEITRILYEELKNILPSSTKTDLYGEAERIKIKLSESEKIKIRGGEGKYYSRVQFETIFRMRFQRIMNNIKWLLNKYGLKNPDVFLLSGLSSNIFLLKIIIEQNFSDTKIDYLRDKTGAKQLKECVAKGCAILGEEFSGVPGPESKVLKIINKSATSIGFLKREKGGLRIFHPIIPWGGELNKEYIIPNEFISFKELNKILFLIYESFLDEEVPGKDPNCVKLGRVEVNLKDFLSGDKLKSRDTEFSMMLKEGRVLIIRGKIGEKINEYKLILEDVY